MSTDLLDWHEEDQTIDPEAEYRTLLNGLRRTEGFGLFFVQCSLSRGEQIVQRTRRDLPGKRVEVMKLEAPVADGNLFKRIHNFVEEGEKASFLKRLKKAIGASKPIDIVFIQGLERSLLDYEESKKRLGWSSEKIFSYSWHGVPPVLINLNQQRERFRDSFNTRFVFLLPVFAVKYLVHRAPDFFDWRSGIARMPEDIMSLSREAHKVTHDSGYQIYCTWPQEKRNQRILEIQSLLDADTLSDQERLSLHCEQASLFTASKDYTAANLSDEAALSIKPNDPLVLYRKKTLYRQNSVFSAPAQGASITTPYIQPDHHETKPLSTSKFEQGNSLLDSGRYEDAIAAYDSALALQPNYPAVLNNRGNALYNLGRYEEAIAAYAAALAIQPDLHEALYNKGNTLTNLGRYEAAIAAYDAALSIQPDYPDALNNKGSALFNLGRHEAAIAAYDAALAIKPDKHEALNNKGGVLSKLGRYEEAIAAYDAALAIQPDKHEALYNKACCYGLQGQVELALENLERAIQLNPDENRELAKTDTDFDAIRDDPRFQVLLAAGHLPGDRPQA